MGLHVAHNDLNIIEFMLNLTQPLQNRKDEIEHLHCTGVCHVDYPIRQEFSWYDGEKVYLMVG